jgi:flagellar protein FlbD
VIQLTRLNNTHFYLNPELILTVESTPDTIVTLVNGTILVVKESAETIRQSYIDYRRQVSWMPSGESQQKIERE